MGSDEEETGRRNYNTSSKRMNEEPEGRQEIKNCIHFSSNSECPK